MVYGHPPGSDASSDGSGNTTPSRTDKPSGQCLILFMPPQGSQDGGVRVPGHDDRPWGSYTVLEDAADHKVKRIMVAPGKRLSYQRHAHRSEHWFVVRGHALVTLDGDRIQRTSGDAIDIPCGAAHRIENVGGEELVFIEVQRGDYFGEDDIERLEDDFGRMG